MFHRFPFKRALSTHIVIQAPVEDVWRALIDFPTYAEWNRLLSDVDTRLEPGADFDFSIDLKGDGKRLRRQSTLLAVIPNAELRWAGPRNAALRPLFNGNHYLKLTEVHPSTTLVDHGETFGGVLLPALWPMLGPKLERRYVEMNAALKAYVESQSSM